MYFKGIAVNLLVASSILFLFSPVTLAQMKHVYEFKNIEFPFDLKYGDVVIEKGKYNLEFLRHFGTFYLRIKKGSKALCTVPGENLAYESKGMERLSDPTIPEKPNLQIRKIPDESMISVIFETGKHAKIYPLCKASFKIGYDE